MTLQFWRGWSIGLRMAFITLLPVVLLFSIFVGYSWYSHRAQVDEELAERGRILARALAETSEYNVISGDLTDLRLTIKGLVQSDSSIYRIDVIDTGGRNVASAVTEHPIGPQAPGRWYQAPIRKQILWINLFSDNGTPHVSAPSGTRPPTLTTEVVGQVRVTMSPTDMLAKQLHRFLVELALAALALAASGGLAWVLASQVAERTRDLVESRNEALRADADKRKLIQKVNSIIEDERKSIAVEIHDELNASLIAVRLGSQTIQQLAAKAPPGPEIEQIRANAQAITKLALDLYANGRRLVRRLRPEVLDMLGLHGAVEEMVNHYRSSGVRFEFESKGDFSRIGNELAISAYRIVQEALSNIMKHSHAGFARVSLVLEDDDALRIEVEDAGDGFDPALASEGIGIIGMRERVFALGGSIRLQSSPGEGTLVSIRLPLADGTRPA